MTELLVRWFVKDREQVESPKVRTAYSMLACVTGICCNLLLFGAKLLIGLLLHSVSVLSDAFNNLSDAASSVIGLVGVKLAEKPADKEHPFGHGRMEYITALIVSFLVIEVGWTLLKSSWEKVLEPQPLSFSLLSVAVLCGAIGVKLWLMLFYRNLGRRIGSSVMKAASADSLGDVLATGAAVVSVLIYGLAQVNLDGYIGLAVSAAVMVNGVQIARETLEPLIGTATPREVYERITGFVEGYEGVIGSHDLIVHNYGPSRSMASIHAEVPSGVDVKLSHELIDKIERDAAEQLGIYLVIHMDPVETDNEETLACRLLVETVMGELCPEVRFHDFRIVRGLQRINLIFDILVPHSMTEAEAKELQVRIGSEVRKRDGRCRCVITVDRAFYRP